MQENWLVYASLVAEFGNIFIAKHFFCSFRIQRAASPFKHSCRLRTVVCLPACQLLAEIDVQVIGDATMCNNLAY